MNWSGGPLEVAERTWFSSLVSGVTAFDTDEGLVLVDTGMQAKSSRIAEALRGLTSSPVHTAVYTHGHIDHAFGLAAFLLEGQAPPRVIAHRDMPARWDRYVRTTGFTVATNTLQLMGGPTAQADQSQVVALDTPGAPPDDDAVFGVSDLTFAAPATPPTELYDEETTFRVGDLTFQLRHSRGETDDHTWVWCPERSVLCTGDLFMWAVPNAGNPQKVQRYPWDWASALRQMAELRPNTLCPGHGGPVIGDPARIQRMLLETADYLETIVEQVLAAMNEGAPPHVDIVRSVKLPQSDSPWLQPTYDEGEFIARNVIRYFGGWWSGRPSELKPAPRSAVASEVAALAGGPIPLVARAEELADSGDVQLACHLADLALECAPSDPRVQEAVAGLYERRADEETSLMATNIFVSAASYAHRGSTLHVTRLVRRRRAGLREVAVRPPGPVVGPGTGHRQCAAGNLPCDLRPSDAVVRHARRPVAVRCALPLVPHQRVVWPRNRLRLQPSRHPHPTAGLHSSG